MLTENAQQIVTGIRSLYPNEEAWTQRTLARNAAGDTVPPDAPDAVCRCLYGTLVVVLCETEHAADDIKLLQFAFKESIPLPLAKSFNWGDMSTYNDMSWVTFADIEALLDSVAAVLTGCETGGAYRKAWLAYKKNTHEHFNRSRTAHTESDVKAEIKREQKEREEAESKNDEQATE